MTVFRKKRRDGRSKFFYYDFVRKGRRFTGCTLETSEARALQVVLGLRQRLEHGCPQCGYRYPEDVPNAPFDKLVEEFSRLHVSKKRAQGHYNNILAGLSAFFGQTSLSAIGIHEAEEFTADLRDRGRKESTINRFLTLAGQMWDAGQEWGLVRRGVNPWRAIAKGEEFPRDRFLTEPEEERLLAVAPAWLSRLIIASLYTGGRRGQLLQMTWGDIDLETRLLVFRRGDGRRVRAMGISERLQALLKEMRPSAASDRPHVFCGADGEPVNVEALRSAFRRACQRAQVSGLRFNDLRKAAVAYVNKAGIPYLDAGQVLEHKRPAMPVAVVTQASGR